MGAGTANIDSITLVVQSQSLNAAKGIEALAQSLEKLKKNGSFKTVSTNLERLSEALGKLPNVHQSSNALRTLANSIEKLKSVGTVASLSNSLTKLPTALKSLGNINIEKVAPQIRNVVDAVTPLSSLKAGGLSTMVNAMAKLGKVTESLDDETIGKFAAKVELLNEKLGPLSTKMASIKSGFNAINSGARKASAGVNKLGDEIDSQMLNMSSFVTVIQQVAQALQGLIQKFAEWIHVASQWDGIEYQFGNTFGEQADMYYEKITEITDALSINKQIFMENAAMAGSMLLGFGVDAEDAREMGLGYTELAYDIWAAFNNVYETLDGADGAMAAVRSAIAGEVEPIRRAGFTIVEATLEQTAANHGLEISLANATEAQKSYLRYLTLIDQAQRKGIVGAYASEMQTAEGMMRTFSQQLKSLAQAFGSLFLPVLVKVMPWVQAFVELLAEGVYWLAGLFGVEIQPIDFTDYKTGAGAIENVANSAETAKDALDSATESAKALKNATLGIDELNVISPPSASSSSGGAGGADGGPAGGGFEGLDISSLWDESIFDSVQNKVDEIKGKLKDMFIEWQPLIDAIGIAFGLWTIAGLVSQIEDALGLSKNLSQFLGKLAATAIIIVLQFKLMEDSFSDFMGADGTILDYIEGLLIGGLSTYLLYKMWGTGGLVIGLGVTAAVSFKTVQEAGGITDTESAIVAATGLASAFAALSFAIKGLKAAVDVIKGTKFIQWLGAFIALSKEAGFIQTLSAAFPKIANAFASLSGAVKSSGGVWAALKSGITKVGSKLGWIGAIIIAVVAAIDFLIENWKEFTQAVKEFWGENIAPKWEEIKEQFEGLKAVFSELGATFQPIIDELKPIFERTKELIGELFEFIGGVVVSSSFGATMGLLMSFLEWVKGVVQALKGAFEWVTGVIDFYAALFDGKGGKTIEDALNKIKDGIVNTFTGLYHATIGPIVEWFNGVVKWFVKLWDVLVGHSIVPDTINAIVDWFVSLPGRVLGSIKGFVENIIKTFDNLGESLSNKFSSAWESVKSWWSRKPALSSYTPSIGDIKSKLSSAWSTAKTWWDGKKGSLKTYTPSIGSIYDNLKSRWDSARTWWNEKKSTLKSYTPSIGSIYDKLSERWKNAKDWWNSKKGSMSYTPSIGSIVDKIKSAWNTAKSWWNKNAKLSTKLDVKTPKIKVQWDTATAFGKSFKYPTGFKLEFAANGGIFDQGSLVWAGERGPEVLAKAAGGKTGVMNVQQMQDAVYEGVYAAVTAAMKGGMGGGNGTQAVNVYLDGRQITAAVEQRQRERGASIMGNEVYSY